MMSDRPKVPITRGGHERLVGELDQLWRVERPRVTAEVSAAAEMGDRSENAEYIYGKKRLREIDRRIEYLRKRLALVQVIEPVDHGDGRIRFGAWVTLEDEDGNEVRYRLVGEDESDVASGRISVVSPVGRALLGRREGDEVEVALPKGKTAYAVLAVTYAAPEVG